MALSYLVRMTVAQQREFAAEILGDEASAAAVSLEVMTHSITSFESPFPVAFECKTIASHHITK